jgi:hypothetical protein
LQRSLQNGRHAGSTGRRRQYAHTDWGCTMCNPPIVSDEYGAPPEGCLEVPIADVVPDVLGEYHEDHILSDVGGVVADPLEVA